MTIKSEYQRSKFVSKRKPYLNVQDVTGIDCWVLKST